MKNQKVKWNDWRIWSEYRRVRFKNDNGYWMMKQYRQEIETFKGRKRIPIEEVDEMSRKNPNLLLFMSQVEAPKGHVKEWMELAKKIDVPMRPLFITREYSRFNKENFSNCKINIIYCDRDSRSSDDFGYYLRCMDELPEYCNIISEAVETIDLIIPSLNGIVREVNLYLDTRPTGKVDVSVKNINYFNCIRKREFSYDEKDEVVFRIEKDKNDFFVSANPYGEENPYKEEDNKKSSKIGIGEFGISEESLDHWNSYLNELMRSIENQIKSVIDNMDQNIKDSLIQGWTSFCSKEREKIAGGRTAGEWEEEFSMWDK